MPSIDGTIPACEGDIRWMAPERVMGSGRVTIEGDVWAFGMTILVCLSHSSFRIYILTKSRRSYSLEIPLSAIQQVWCNT